MQTYRIPYVLDGRDMAQETNHESYAELRELAIKEIVASSGGGSPGSSRALENAISPGLVFHEIGAPISL
jgi:hypothetical protein